MDWLQVYRKCLLEARRMPDGEPYVRGLQRGFEGPGKVPDAEHRKFLDQTDCVVLAAYVNGVLQGWNVLLGFKG